MAMDCATALEGPTVGNKAQKIAKLGNPASNQSSPSVKTLLSNYHWRAKHPPE